MRTSQRKKSSTTSILNFLQSSKNISSRNGADKGAVEPSLKKQKIEETARGILRKSMVQEDARVRLGENKTKPDNNTLAPNTGILKESDKENLINSNLHSILHVNVNISKNEGETEQTPSVVHKQTTSRKRYLESSSDVESAEKIAPMLIGSKPIEFQAVTKQEPAYRKYAPLLQTQSKTGLPLPPTFQKLLKLFVGVEVVLNYMKSRNTIAIFHKIQHSVERQAGCSFSTDSFSQIVTIYPEAFKLTSVGVMINDERIQSFTIELYSDPIKDKFLSSLDRTPQGVTYGPRATIKTNILEEQSKMMDAIKKLGEQTLIRRFEFQKRLEERVKALHETFLSEKGLEWSISAIKPMWHPDFNLSTIPNIEKAELPIKKIVPLLEALKRKSAAFNGSLKNENSIVSSAGEPVKESDSVKEITKNDNTPSDPLKTEKTLSRAQALLERVREKQRLKAEFAKANPKASPEMVKRRSMLSRARAIASSLLLHVKSNGKSVLTMSEAISHLQLSFPNFFLNSAQWYEHIELLVEIVPTFCSKEVMISCAHLKTFQSQHYLLRFHETGRMKTVVEKIDEFTKIIN